MKLMLSSYPFYVSSSSFFSFTFELLFFFCFRCQFLIYFCTDVPFIYPLSYGRRVFSVNLLCSVYLCIPVSLLFDCFYERLCLSFVTIVSLSSFVYLFVFLLILIFFPFCIYV
uniref:Uncharacterized protein n=1 Tax=Trypanosoma congolense (strain IL3000) TaxID=1068625 RepID=G0USP1_TRYCI|nr:hypothetical protein, unlikely [Trypanosoma congolense IL3000]